jgi:ribosomal protein S18 acetylase RimI-like enzyme
LYLKNAPRCSVLDLRKSRERATKLTIRGGTETDLPKIERHYGPLDNVGDPFCDTTKIEGVRFDWLLIGEIDGEYAGFLYWHLGEKPFFAPHLERFAHIREVQVLEKFQGQGVGRALTVKALDRLKALGVQDVFLATAETNTTAQHLYESLGFKPFRKQIHYSLEPKATRQGDRNN